MSNITWRELKEFCNKLEDKHLDTDVLFQSESGNAFISSIDRLGEDHILTDEAIEPKSAYSAYERKKGKYPVVWKKGYPTLWADDFQNT